MAEDDRAERSRREADEIGREREQRGRERVGGGKKQFRKDQRRGDAVEKEVVPLDGRADGRGSDRPDHHAPARGGIEFAQDAAHCMLFSVWPAAMRMAGIRVRPLAVALLLVCGDTAGALPSGSTRADERIDS